MKSSSKYHLIVDDDVIEGHEKYLDIMRMINDQTIDVSANEEFQRIYKGYYFPAQITSEFTTPYFKYMQESRSQIPSFREAINHIYGFSRQVHYSFASKLIHTINPQNPVLDKHILRLMGFQLVDSGKKEKRIDYYCSVFKIISTEYSSYENMEFMQEAINEFNSLFPKYREISYSKKVDMLLFRLRNERCVSILEHINCLSSKST